MNTQKSNLMEKNMVILNQINNGELLKKIINHEEVELKTVSLALIDKINMVAKINLQGTITKLPEHMPYAYVLHGQLYYDNCGDDVSDEFVIGIVEPHSSFNKTCFAELKNFNHHKTVRCICWLDRILAVDESLRHSVSDCVKVKMVD